MNRSRSQTFGFFALVSVSLFIAFFPIYTPSFAPSYYDGARSLEFIALSSFSVLAIFFLASNELTSVSWSYRPRTVFAVIAFLALACVSAAHSDLPLQAISELGVTWLLIMTLMTVAACCQWRKSTTDRALIASYCFSALAFSVIFSIAYFASVSADAAFSWYTRFVNFGNVRHFSQYQTYTLPLIVLPLLFTDFPRRWRRAAFLLASTWWALQFAVGTRSVWFALAATVIFLALFLRRQAAAWISLQAKSLVVGAVIYVGCRMTFLVNEPGLGSVFQRGFDTSGRWELWSAAVKMIIEFPLLGVGPMHYSFQNFEIAAHPHNSLLQIAAEYGLPAAFLIIVLVAQLLFRGLAWCKNASGSDGHINVGLIASIFAGMTDSLLSGNNLMPHSQVTLFILIGWLIGRNIPKQRIEIRHSSSRASEAAPHLLVITITVVALAIIGWNTVSYYEYTRTAPSATASEIAHPRFWQNGHWPVR